MKKTSKPVYYTAMTILVEMEVPANSQKEADSILRHKMQTFAATNSDLAVHKMEPLDVVNGYDLEALP